MGNLSGADKLRRGIMNTKLKKKLGEKCVYCGCTNKLILTVDHIKPIARGGGDTESNKQIICLICNIIKGALTHGEYLKYYKSLMVLKDLNKVKLNIGNFKMSLWPDMFPMEEKHIIEDKKQDACIIEDKKHDALVSGDEQ